jgi:hypothetical protein
MMLRAKYASALKYASMRSMLNALSADGATQTMQHLQLHINKNVSNVNQ